MVYTMRYTVVDTDRFQGFQPLSLTLTYFHVIARESVDISTLAM